MHHIDDSSVAANSRPSDFDVELCHAFVSAVAESNLLCKPCKKGLVQRYLHSKERNDLIFKVYRRINELDRPLLTRIMHELGGPEDFQRALRDLNDLPHLSLLPEATTDPKRWDTVNIEKWGNLKVWLKVLAKEEIVLSHPLTNQAFKTSAWRSRIWAAVAGRYTLDDLRNQRSIQRFLDDHEAWVLESCLWPADASIPRLAKYEITPAACYCFPLGDEPATFDDHIETLSPVPWVLREEEWIDFQRRTIMQRLVRAFFDPEIVQGVFQRCAPPNVWEVTIPFQDPFEAFVEYWDTVPVRQAVRSLLGLAPESSSDMPAADKAEQVTRAEKEPASKSFSLRRGATFKHPGVEIGYHAYHPLTPRTKKEGPVDYEAEARKIRARHDVETEEWLDPEY